jgi:predicted nucleic acid-binding protein
MTGSTFVDSSVLVHAEDHGEPDERAMALKRLADHVASDDIVLSAQVLSEFYVAVRRLRRPLSAAQALRALEQLAVLPVVPVTADLVVAAAAAAERYQVSHWDALILETARAAGCSVVLSEDARPLGFRVPAQRSSECLADSISFDRSHFWLTPEA